MMKTFLKRIVFLLALLVSLAGTSLYLTSLVTADLLTGFPALVADIYPGSSNSTPGGSGDGAGFAVYSDTLYFSADDGTTGIELWSYDGITATLAADIYSGDPSYDSYPKFLTVHNGVLYFQAYTAAAERELWSFDGNTATIVRDIYPGTNGSGPEYLTVYSDTLYFSAGNGANGVELWKSDGTFAGTVMAADVWPGNFHSSPEYLTVYSDTLYFTARDSYSPQNWELWSYDGNSAALVADINPTGGSSPKHLTVYSDTLYFVANSTELWSYDGITHTLVSSLTSDGWSSPQYFTVYSDTLYFAGTDDKLWAYDGSAAPAAVVDLTSVSYLTVYSDTLYFRANDGSTGNELWSYDGITTTLVADINPGSGSSSPFNITAFDNQLYFGADDGTGTSGRELWQFPGPADFGDAPTNAQSGFASDYPTTLANDGANHAPSGPTLGDNRDVESDGVPSADADGDDTTGSPDDEDGISFPTSALLLSASSDTGGSVQVDLQNADGSANRLDAWIDFNRDGDWDDTGEQIFSNQDLGITNSVQTLAFTIPSGASAGDTFARFRLSIAGGLSSTGAASDGEVEDYKLALQNISGAFSVNLPDGGGDTELTVEGGFVILKQGGVELFKVPEGELGNLELTIVGGAGDDNLYINYENGNPVPADPGFLHFDGGTGSDTLFVIAGTFDDVEYDATGEGEGELDVDGNIVTFENLEPVVMTGSTANLTINIDPTGSLSGTITTTISALSTYTTHVSLSSGLESLDFMTVTNKLTVTQHISNADLILVQGFGSAFDGDLIISGGSRDLINFQTASSDLGAKDMSVTAEWIEVNASITTVDGDLTFTADDIELGAAVDAGSGTVSFVNRTDGTEIHLGASTGNAPAAKLYWVDAGADTKHIRRSDMDGSNVEDVATGLAQPVGIAVDASNGKVYWTDGGINDHIMWADLGGTRAEEIVTGVTGVKDIAVGNDSIFWVDSLADHLQSADLDGGNVITPVIGLASPQGIAIDTTNGQVYWSDNSTDLIRRADLNGANVQDIVTGLASPQGVSLDVDAGRIYWVDNGGSINRIQSADMVVSNTNVLTLVVAPVVDDPTGLALDLVSGNMYWTDSDNAFDQIRSADLDGSDVITVVAGLNIPHHLDILFRALTLTDAELDNVTAGKIVVGSSSAGDVIFAAAVNPANAGTLDVISGADIGDTNTTGADFGGSQLTLDGNVSPGMSPGILSVDANFAFADNDTFSVEIGGALPGTGDDNHDQILVTGTVTLGSNVTLSTTAWNSYTPTEGKRFTIIDNDGTDAVVGTFSGLAEGATVSADLFGSGLKATISYAGGTGNDVVLIMQSADLVIVKTVDTSPAAPGDTITYTLTFYNAGDTTASGVVITDSIPVSVSVSSVISDCDVAIDQTITGGYTYTWQVADLANAAGGTITITGVLSNPLATGAFTNTATITTTSVDGDLTNNMDEVGLTVGPPTAPEITVAPLSLTFGDQDMDAGPTLSQTVTITNDGTANLTISDVTPTGDTGEFNLADSGESTLTPGNTRTIEVSFNPSSAGAKAATLTIQSDDSDEPTVEVNLSGTGTVVATPEIFVLS
ncbi:MAG: choice-of-anchor D domain-containing protein [Chloroflexi bacterium]|nr:choice-of-anchor D domain-containing protein [Chloroflexota bacterium]